eukprot:CAMPEP_0196806350 /NCGR_PEP_ID=MMETSP1362-20130617/6252_1 /TAXON_ID=163516 /ORGANISM="Leptocylindrus danicus, Strain CCMP1856" /LENGTH=365 /DNA_ID=CAMNT_0042179791 /DNA_START=90 /DNA_END=1184 /DNA_ORIENTATION=+
MTDIPDNYNHPTTAAHSSTAAPALVVSGAPPDNIATSTTTTAIPQERPIPSVDIAAVASSLPLPMEQAVMVQTWLQTVEEQRRCSKRKRVDEDSATASLIMSTSTYVYAASCKSGDNNETDAEEEEDAVSSICSENNQKKAVASPIMQDVVSIHREDSQAEDLLSHFCSKSKQTQCSDDDDDDDDGVDDKKNKKLRGLQAWTAEKCKSGENEARWMTKFELLKQYKVKHGDCLVRKRDKTLGQWVYDQRKHYRLLKEGKKAKISQNRIDMLESIGFAWSSMSNNFVKYDKLWMSKFEEFKRFMEVNGSGVAPEKGTQLCKWIENQRYQYIGFQKGKQSKLTQERVNLLNSVGFIWRKEYLDDTTC